MSDVKRFGADGALCGDASHTFSLELEAVGVVDEPVEDGIGERRAANDLVPLLHRHLAGDNGRTAPVPVLQDLQHFLAFWLGQHRQAPVVEYQ